MRSADGTLPDFLIIGAFKSGTTSLVSYLSQHPGIFMPRIQEPAYFASPRYDPRPGGDPSPQRAPESMYGRLRAETLSQYLALFQDAPTGAIAGESSPQYMRDPPACDRIARALPDAKLIAVLRHPADRAFSDYMMFVRDGLETVPFAEVVARPRSLTPPNHFVETGFYGRQLQRYYDAFPAEQIRVVLLEELSTDALATLRDLFAWLGADPSFVPDPSDTRNVSGQPANALVAAAYALRRRLQPHLVSVVPRPLARAVDRRLRKGLRTAVPEADVMKHLQDVYRDDIALLARLSGRNLQKWLR